MNVFSIYRNLKIGIFILLINFTFVQLYSQENNYWTVQQGATAALTGSAVIANARNHTAAYYNPGLLPFVKSNSVSLNASTYFLKNVSIENGAGENIDLENTRAGLAAFFIAFMTVSVYWMKHLEHFGIIMKVNQTFITFQLVFLALIMLVPFWSTYVSQTPDNLTIKLFFSGNMILIGLFSFISMKYAVKNKLIYDKVTPQNIRSTKIQILTEPAIAFLACGLGFINPNYWDIAFIMIPILFATRKKLIKTKYFSHFKN